MQQYKESEDAQRYMTFYPVNKWPYVTVLDPRTGEKLVEWNAMDANTFIELVTEFLSSKPKGLDTANPLEPVVKKRKKDEDGKYSIIDADEDDQIAAAIRASLAQSPKKSVNIDSDSDFGDPEEDDDSDSDCKSESTSAAKKSKELGKKLSNSTATPSESSSSDVIDGATDSKSWEDYLGSEEDPKSSLMIRFPDGQREAKKLPSSSKLLVSDFKLKI